MKKYRIVEIEMLDGSTVYDPQEKGWFFWRSLLLLGTPKCFSADHAEQVIDDNKATYVKSKKVIKRYEA